MLQENTINYLDENTAFIENELMQLDEKFEFEAQKIELNDDLAQALNEFENLKSQLPKEQTATLLELCKDNVLDTITSQFGLASLFIDARDGGSVTTTHNFEKGITSNASDASKYQEFKRVQELKGEDWQKYRHNNYDQHNNYKAMYDNTDQIVVDGYTNKKIPKSYTDVEHIVSVKEIESNASNHLYLSVEQRAEIASSDKNLIYADRGVNRSKRDNNLKEWLEDGNPEYTSKVDKKVAMKKYDDAKKNENKKRTIEALKKNSKELLQTGTKDAAKIAAYSAIGIILKDLVQGIMIELRLTFEKRGDETLREIFNRFKDRVSKILVEIKSKWKDILAGSLEAGITAFLSNIVVFVVNLFATTLKRFVAIIRAGFVSLVQAIKILANPPADMPKDEINYQALKVLTAGLIGALSLGLTEGIEKLLLSVPVLTPIMSLPLPFGDQTIGDAIAVTLSAMCGGLLTTVALYFMDKAQRETKESKIQIQLMAKSGEIVHMKVAQTWVVLGEAYDEFFNDAKQSYAKFEQAKLEINQSTKQASESVENFSKTMANLRSKLKQITKE
ncbi:hypothetical protein [Campylobacter concisus]|uniref:Uncharacterized protein n=1 Tax=Campylobacter concisus TaxID=199 RepID=A0A7S9WT95_9BACT|nr:hypothetical protein [Campylobacter concisus]QPH92453.1 hypothetical protein CVT01_08030 [Campylobacter concisus]